jgi:hypothetical protein
MAAGMIVRPEGRVRLRAAAARTPSSCSRRSVSGDSPGLAYQYPALMWQPRVIGVLVLVGLATQSPAWFLTLSALLWWSAVLPRLNPFDAAHNALVATPKGRPRLGPAPAPRRFAQAMAAMSMLAIGLSLLHGWTKLAWPLEGLLFAALVALILGRFCLGSYVFLLLTGHGGFARRTLPWAGDEPSRQTLLGGSSEQE